MAVDSIQLTGTTPAGVVFIYYDGVTGNPWSTVAVAYEAWQDGHYANYRIAAAQQGTGNRWTASRPTGVAAPFSFVSRLAAASVLANEIPLGGANTEPVARSITVNEHTTVSGN